MVGGHSLMPLLASSKRLKTGEGKKRRISFLPIKFDGKLGAANSTLGSGLDYGWVSSCPSKGQVQKQEWRPLGRARYSSPHMRSVVASGHSHLEVFTIKKQIRLFGNVKGGPFARKPFRLMAMNVTALFSRVAALCALPLSGALISERTEQLHGQSILAKTLQRCLGSWCSWCWCFVLKGHRRRYRCWAEGPVLST